MGHLTTLNTVCIIWSIITTSIRTQATISTDQMLWEPSSRGDMDEGTRLATNKRTYATISPDQMLVDSPDQMLWDSSSRGDLDEVKSLLGTMCTDADVNYKSGYSNVAPLHLAAEYNHNEVILFLLSCNDTEVDLKNDFGDTALMMASLYNNPDIIHILITAGAGVNLRDRNNRTALMLASWKDNPDSIKALLSAGAEINLQNFHGKTALMESIMKINPNITNTLLLGGADVNLKDNVGRTALHYVSHFSGDRIEQVKVLLHHCANATIITDSGKTAADSARYFGRMDILQMIEKYIEANNCTAPDTHNWIDDTIVTPGTNNYIDATPEYGNTAVASPQPLRVFMSFIRDIIDSMIAG